MLKKTLLILLFSIFACNNLDPNTDPNDQYNPDYGSFKIDTLYATQTASVRKNFSSSATSSKLSVGKLNGLEATTLIQFSSVLFPPDTIVTDSVFLYLTTAGGAGNDMGGQININFYLPDSSWTFNVNQSEYWRTLVPQNLITSNSLSTRDSSLNKIALPASIFDSWKTKNSGIMLKSAEMFDYIIELQAFASGSTSDPFLVYYSQGSADTIPSPLVDASVFNYDPAQGNALEESIDNVIISSGVPTAALLSFDLNSIEANSILFDADLELIIDVSNSIDFRDDFTQIFVRSVISANNDFSNIEIDSVFTTSSAFNFSLLKVDDGKKLRLSGTDRIDFAKGFIQQVVNSERESQFLYLHYVGDGDDASVLRFFNEKQIDELKPKLIIKYLQANNSGF